MFQRSYKYGEGRRPTSYRGSLVGWGGVLHFVGPAMQDLLVAISMERSGMILTRAIRTKNPLTGELGPL